MISKKFAIFYFTILALEIISGEIGFTIGVYILKPAIVGSLIYVVSTRSFRENSAFIAALVFSLLGDILLMLPSENLFLFGLGSFLITHLFYIAVFRKKATFKPFLTVAFLISVIGFFLLILNNKIPQALTLPVLIYMFVITVMGITASSINGNKIAIYSLSIGAILFIISDSLITLNKFTTPIPYPTLLIMSTYGIGQFLITKGYLSIFAQRKTIS